MTTINPGLMRRPFHLVAILAGLAACAGNDDLGDDGDDAPPPDAALEPDASPPPEAPTAVYVLSNELDANRVIVYDRAPDGSVRPGNAYTTGGKGSGGGLGSQGALVFDAATQRFFAVNAGDHSISLLALQPDGSLVARSNVASGGVKPVSITTAADLVYVVNAGDATTSAGITGFRIIGDVLTPIAGSSRPLSTATPAPAQIQFSPDGSVLVVTEKATNMIDTYVVTGGIASAPQVQPSVGITPFGFAFGAGGELVVSEAFGGGVGLSAATSYAVSATGTLTPISSSVPSGQSAACWVVIARGHAYTTNTASNTLSAYTVTATGSLTLDHTDGIAATSDTAPIDADVADGDGYLYVLDAGADAISTYAIAADGGLTRLPEVRGLSASAVGLIAR